ncbi:hypothetical protein [Thalassiella azotivora]
MSGELDRKAGLDDETCRSSGNDDVLVCSVDHLLRTFRQALLALVPAADAIQLSWCGDEHPDWERLAQAVFSSFVTTPVLTDRGALAGLPRGGRPYALARYDIDREDSYRDVSFVRVHARNRLDELVAFIRFLSDAEPMDWVQGAALDPVTLMVRERLLFRYADVSFSLMRRMPSTAHVVVRHVWVDA